MKKQRVVEQNLRKIKQANIKAETDQFDEEEQFLNTPLGKRLKGALRKMLNKKVFIQKHLQETEQNPLRKMKTVVEKKKEVESQLINTEDMSHDMRKRLEQ